MSKPKPNSFERLFERHMKGGNVSDFKREYLTLYTMVIRPIERQRDQLLIDIAAHVDAEGMWERLMMELVGEDGPGSVRTAIEQLKLERGAYLQEVKELRAKVSMLQDSIRGVRGFLIEQPITTEVAELYQSLNDAVAQSK